EPALLELALVRPAAASAPVVPPISGAAASEPALGAAANSDEAPILLRPFETPPAEDEPLFAPHGFGEDRRQKGGWLSLFGRPRHEPGRPPSAARPGPVPEMLEPVEPLEADEREDLEIPAFIRRLAN
ncbi:MAG: hypothetical protein JOZ27_04520, partial [Caulobacteraceae bacterium]|nr:hypothetical protein [Caulobacteraceae bacterium]